MNRAVLHRAWTILIDDGPCELARGAIRFFRWRYPFFEVKIRYHINKIRYASAAPEPFKVMDVSPRNISQWYDDFGMFHHVGAIRGGDWDLNARPLEDHVKYRAVLSHFNENEPWEDTGIFDYHKKRIKRRGQSDGYNSMDEIRERYLRLDEIYKEIQENGFQTPSESAKGKLSRKQKLDFPAVHIGRSGELIHGDGWHRLAMAHTLNLEKIPVRVITRHSKWQKIRVSVAKNGIFDEYECHPDLEKIATEAYQK